MSVRTCPVMQPIRLWGDLASFAGSVVACTCDPLPSVQPVRLDSEDSLLRSAADWRSLSASEHAYETDEDQAVFFAYVRADWVYSITGERGYEVVDLPEMVADESILVGGHCSLCSVEDQIKEAGGTAVAIAHETLTETAVVWTTSYLLTFLRAAETNLRMRKATAEEIWALRAHMRTRR